MVPSGKVEAITSQALRNIRVPDYHEYVPFVVVPTQSRTSFLVYDSSLNMTYNPNSNMSNTTSGTSGTRTGYLPITRSGVQIAQSFVFCLVVCGPLVIF